MLDRTDYSSDIFKNVPPWQIVTVRKLPVLIKLTVDVKREKQKMINWVFNKRIVSVSSN